MRNREIMEKGGAQINCGFTLNGKANKMSEETQHRIQQIIDETVYSACALFIRQPKRRSHWRDSADVDPHSQSFQRECMSNVVRFYIDSLLEALAILFKNEREHAVHVKSRGRGIYHSGHLPVWNAG